MVAPAMSLELHEPPGAQARAPVTRDLRNHVADPLTSITARFGPGLVLWLSHGHAKRLGEPADPGSQPPARAYARLMDANVRADLENLHMDTPMTGVVPVVPTIFRDDDAVDLDGTARVVDYVID